MLSCQFDSCHVITVVLSTTRPSGGVWVVDAAIRQLFLFG
jgi:hypothetical protein